MLILRFQILGKRKTVWQFSFYNTNTKKSFLEEHDTNLKKTEDFHDKMNKI